MSTKVVQVTNIAPQATKDQMQNLFGCIGKIDEIRLYPTVRDVTCPVVSRVCYVKFFESSCVAVAQHLTNTVFIDRALIVCPVANGMIPDEFKALEIINNGSTVPGLPANDSQLPPDVVNRVEGTHPFQVIKTSDPKLVEFNLPEYPPLPINFDARKIEEIRRTIILIDIPADWELQEIIKFFGEQAGEVKYARFAEKSRQKHVMIEFCDQKSVVKALKMQGSEFLGKRLNIYHSMQAIIKPEAKSNEAAQREIEEAMSIVKETHMISAALEPVIGILSSKEKSVTHRRSRTRSRSSRSRSRSRRSKSRKRSKRSRSSKRRSASRSRSKRSRSRSRSRRKRSRSRSKRPRSRDRERRRRSRSTRRRSRSVSRERRRSRSRSHERRERRERDTRRRHSRSPQSSKPRKSTRKEEKRRKSRTRSKSRDRRHATSSRRERRDERDEKPKERRREKEQSRSRSKESSRKPKRISEEKPSQRDYDAEERIGTEDSSKRESSDDASEKDMDIANSP
ncbi:probable splicing factor, arginine/serine-rich 7 [Sitodiplosis mosellana]|uniref:probable splicing factor, arginine/serine-rich 7 n=1 Tax=Sitodiplosis mosellana TaxID=263140 RepID=UPI0024441FFB|nr:probable splicing factor, arginine/serine-rich 7 [Sitodiplosis mosellana]